MAASTLISNIPSERSNLRKTDGKQKVKDIATVQVIVIILSMLVSTIVRMLLYTAGLSEKSRFTPKQLRKRKLLYTMHNIS